MAPLVDNPSVVSYTKDAMSGTFYNLLIYGIIALVINSVKYYKDLQQEQAKSFTLENKLVETRMQFLKQQLQPHFLLTHIILYHPNENRRTG